MNSKKYRINYQIKSNEVRLVGDNIENGIYSIQEAKRIARDLDLDLIEISPKANPPVCKILDFSKFLYEKKKKQKEQKKNQTKVEIKEIRFTPNTDDHDFNHKLKKARQFLEKKKTIKASVFFKGRNIQFKDRGELVLLKFVKEVGDLGSAQALPKLEGKRMIVIVNPNK